MLLIWFTYVAAFNFSPVDLLSKPLSRKKRSDEFIPCDDGWFLFREKCLTVRGTSWKHEDRATWAAADANCRNAGGNLVTIQSKEELNFIIHFLLVDVSVAAWIGLRKGPNSTFTWSDGSAVNFTNWKQEKPPNDANEDCIQMNYAPAINDVGRWEDFRCNKWYGYICQKRMNKRMKSRNPQFCTTEEGGGWRFQNTCYHIVMEMKNWNSAEQHCQDYYGGHLATILHKGMDIYLDNLLSSINGYLWIGMKITDGLEQKWSSGWTVTYNRTTSHYADVSDGTCVLRRNSTVWDMAPCSKKYPFICDTIRDPPVLKPAANGSYCPKIPSDWKDLGGEYCYFFETSKSSTWFEASYECKRRGGNLASIHSQGETDLIQPFLKYVTVLGYWVGLVRQLVREDVFIWSDGTPMDYEYWSYWEPSSEGEKCGEVWPEMMDWNDAMCTDKRGYICSVRKVTPNLTETAETNECTSPIYYKALIGVSVSLHLVLILLGVVVYCVRLRKSKRQKESTVAAISHQNSLATFRRQYRSQAQPKVKVDEPHYEDMTVHYESVY